MNRRGDLEQRKPGWQSPGDLEERELTIAGIRRTYWLARAQVPSAPLLIALHGSGMTGRAMAKFTGLGMRGPAAGITTVFPDGWHAARPPERQPNLDDVLFLSTLSAHLEAIGVAQAWPVFPAGLRVRGGGRLNRGCRQPAAM